MLEIQRACMICNPILVCLGHNFIHITGNLHDSLFLMPSMFLESWAMPEGKLGIGVCDDIYQWWWSGLGLRSEGRLPLYYWEKIYLFPSSHFSWVDIEWFLFFFFPMKTGLWNMVEDTSCLHLGWLPADLWGLLSGAEVAAVTCLLLGGNFSAVSNAFPNCWNSLRGKYKNKCLGFIFHWTEVSLELTAPHTTHLAGKSIGDQWGQSDSDCQLVTYIQSKRTHQKLILCKACFWFVHFSGRLGLCPITFLQ